MIEQGILKMVQTAPAVAALASGGWLAELPKDVRLPAWRLTFFGGEQGRTLLGERGVTRRRMQIDCYCGEPSAAVAVAVAAAIDGVLDEYHGTLPDDEATGVQRCWRPEEPMDFPLDEGSRTYRRMLEYEIWFFPKSN